MKPFDYLAPKSLNAALQAIREKGVHYMILAGGTNLIPNLREGKVRPKLVVDLNGLKRLNYVKVENGKVRIGALTTISDLLQSALIREHAPILCAACSQFAGPVVRNRATVGGNLVDASPAADTAVPLLALGAQIRLQSLNGRRTLTLDEFFTAYRKTAIAPGEILTEVVFPIPPRGTGYGYCKLGRRNAMAISVASVGVVLNMMGKTCEGASIAMGAVAPTPLRVKKVESLLRGREVDGETARKCGKYAAEGVRPIDDIRASAEYRRAVTEALVCRAICESIKQEGM